VQDGEKQHLCPRCDTPFVQGQEYCLECGQRLGATETFVGRLGSAWRARLPWYPGDWIWPVLLGLVIAIAGAVAAVAIASSGRNGNTLVATHAGAPREPSTPPTTATVALPTVPRGTPTTSGPPATPSTPPPATSAPRPANGLTAWPPTRSGYTVVIESIPARAGRAFAVSRARSAAHAGLPQVGVLDSSRFSSLHPGFWVVYSGVDSSAAAAEAGRQRVSAKGFAGAYTRQITP
jgi:hypothetical protein